MSVTFLPNQGLKYFRKGRLLTKFEYRLYKDKTLCAIACIEEYINVVIGLEIQQFTIITKKPYRGASNDTMQRWVKGIFADKTIIGFSLWVALSSNGSLLMWIKLFSTFSQFNPNQPRLF